MDAHLSAETQTPGSQCIRPHALWRIYIRGNTVDGRLNAREPRNEHNLRTEIQKLVFLRGHSEIELKIDGAEQQALHAFRASHCRRVPETLRGLNLQQ